MADLNPKITITAVDKVSPVLKNVSKNFAGLQKSIKGITNNFQDVIRSTEKFGKELRKVAFIGVAAGGALFGITKHAADMAIQLNKNAKLIGINTEQLQKLEYAAKLAGVPAEDLVSSLKSLQQAMLTGALDPNSDEAKFFRRMHIDIKNTKDSLAVFLQLSDKFKNSTDPAREIFSAKAIFGTESILPLLKEGSAGIQAAGSNIPHLLTANDIVRAQEFQKSLIGVTFAFHGLAQSVGQVLFPVIQPLMESLSLFVKENDKELIQLFKDLGEAFKDIALAVVSVSKAMAPFIKQIGGIKTLVYLLAGLFLSKLVLSFGKVIFAVVTLTKAFGGLNFVMNLNPAFRIATAVLALAGAIGLAYANSEKLKASLESFSGQNIPQFPTEVLSRFDKPINSANDLKSGLPAYQRPAHIKSSEELRSDLANWFKEMIGLKVDITVDSKGNPSVANVEATGVKLTAVSANKRGQMV